MHGLMIDVTVYLMPSTCQCHKITSGFVVARAEQVLKIIICKKTIYLLQEY